MNQRPALTPQNFDLLVYCSADRRQDPTPVESRLDRAWDGGAAPARDVLMAQLRAAADKNMSMAIELTFTDGLDHPGLDL